MKGEGQSNRYNDSDIQPGSELAVHFTYNAVNFVNGDPGRDSM